MPWGFAAVAAATLGGAYLTSTAAGDAANTQAAAADKASTIQEQQFQKTQTNEQPYMDAGGNALTALQRGLGIGGGNTSGTGSLNAPFTTADFHNSPGYQFQMQEGEGAVLNNASHFGGVNSGNTLKALTKFGQGNANQDYWNAYNAFTNRQTTGFNQLQTIAGSGQNAAANLGSLGSATATNVGNNIIGAGNSTSAGQVAGATAISNGAQGVGQNFLLYSLLNGGGLPGGGGGGGFDMSQIP